MTTELGRKYCINRISCAGTLADLEARWNNFGGAMRKDPAVYAAYLKRKKQLKGGK